MTRDEIISCFISPSAETTFHRGDHDLNQGMKMPPAPTPAAVLIPILLHQNNPTILFTLRTPHLTAHASQISFPGGRIDPVDRDSTATALREAREEIGLAADAVEVIGRLDRYVTRTGYAIDPIVGLIDPGFQASPDPFEVAEVFEVPLQFFLISENRRIEFHVIQKERRRFHIFNYDKYCIWGATAGMLVNLIELLQSQRAKI